MRTFIGLPIPDDAREKIAKLDILNELNISLKKAEMHVTLVFLGETQEIQLAGIKQAMDKSVAGLGKFKVVLDRVRAFPDESAAKTVWLNVAEGSEELVKINGAIVSDEALSFMEKEKRAYLPHATLARLKKPVDITRWAGAVEEISFIAGKITLYKSELTGAGAVYTVLHESRIE